MEVLKKLMPHALKVHSHWDIRVQDGSWADRALSEHCRRYLESAAARVGHMEMPTGFAVLSDLSKKASTFCKM
jgi:hypothetical protein